MNALLVAVMLLLPLSAPFGEASATATSSEDGLLLEVSVEFEGSPVAIVVRGVGSGASELPPVALDDQGNGTWVGIVHIPVIENILLGFEAIPESGPAVISELHTLTELGVDRAVIAQDHPESAFGEEDDEPLVSTEGRRWGWLGLAAGAAALAALAFWTIGSWRNGGPDHSDGETGELVEAEEPGETEEPAEAEERAEADVDDEGLGAEDPPKSG